MTNAHRLLATFLLAWALVLAPFAGRPADALYVMDYGDVVSVAVKDAPQYSFNGPVRPDGVITLPYLGDLEVRGLTTDQVRERVREIVARVLRSPEVSVAVMSYRPRTVIVLGEVSRPGNVDLTRADQTVLDAIALAGGFTDHALGAQVVLLRGNGAGARRIPVDVLHMMQTGDLSANVKLEPGDRIQVPRSPWPTWGDGVDLLRTVATIGTAIFLIIRVTDRVTP